MKSISLVLVLALLVSSLLKQAIGQTTIERVYLSQLNGFPYYTDRSYSPWTFTHPPHMRSSRLNSIYHYLGFVPQLSLQLELTNDDVIILESNSNERTLNFDFPTCENSDPKLYPFSKRSLYTSLLFGKSIVHSKFKTVVAGGYGHHWIYSTGSAIICKEEDVTRPDHIGALNTDPRTNLPSLVGKLALYYRVTQAKKVYVGLGANYMWLPEKADIWNMGLTAQVKLWERDGTCMP